MKRKILAGIIIMVAALDLLAQAPEMFRYQGRLVAGTNLVNATLPMSFKLYDAQNGGNLLYEDSNSVLVVDGLYSAYIGDDTIYGSLVDALTNSAVYLELTIDGGALSPRERLVSIPYALHGGGVGGVTGDVARKIILNGVTNTAVDGAVVLPPVASVQDVAQLQSAMQTKITATDFTGVLKTGLNNYYEFSSLLTSNTVADLSGAGNTATNIGPVIVVNDSAVYNVWSNRTIFTPSQSSNFSIACQFVYSNTSSHYQAIFSEAVNDFIPQQGLYVYSNAGSAKVIYRSIYTNACDDTASFIITPGVPNNIVLTRSNNLVSIWVNGVLKTTKTMSQPRTAKSRGEIGGFSTISGNRFGGQDLSVTRWVMFSKALSTSEAVALSSGTNWLINVVPEDALRLGGVSASEYALKSQLGTIAGSNATDYVHMTTISNYVQKATNAFSIKLSTSVLSFDADNTSTQEMANVLATLIKILQGEALP